MPYAVTSVAWAPSCGRSFHLVATGSRDGCVRVWRVRPPPPSPSSLANGSGNGVGAGLEDEDMGTDSLDEKWSASLVAEFDDHKCVFVFNFYGLSDYETIGRALGVSNGISLGSYPTTP